MLEKKLIVHNGIREKRFGLLKQNKLEAFENWLDENQSIVGNIYVGRVEKVVPGMDAAFVNFGKEKNGFLHKEQLLSFRLASDQSKPITSFLHQGEKIMVQAISDEIDGKGAKLTGIIELSTERLVYMYGHTHCSVSKKMSEEEQRRWIDTASKIRSPHEGLLIRTGMSGMEEQGLIKELDQLRKEYNQLSSRLQNAKVGDVLQKKNDFPDRLKDALLKEKTGAIWVDDIDLYQLLKNWLDQQESLDWSIHYYREKENIFHHFNIEAQLEKLQKRIVWLDHGAYIIIEETEALAVIDVNTGKFTGKQDKEVTIKQTNIMAAKEIMRQIRLRNISGIILVDFINMKTKQNQQAILHAMKEEQHQDDRHVHLVGFTELGLLQLTRKRQNPPLSKQLMINCETCNGHGSVESPQTIAFKLERELRQFQHHDGDFVTIEATKDVISLYEGENIIYKQELEKHLRKAVHFKVLDAGKPTYVIREFGSWK
ncbi:Rne/Rng family ribonuclease [Peribacillus acanthi]|uniref:Rne/Rng family ribonuclease n=1 Tax=Peribacillus acanthi TaxID=2171554 RepID=UPI00130047D0|nr:Rne/Rng family ribonuclease [Peribacillus acanthi]